MHTKPAQYLHPKLTLFSYREVFFINKFSPDKCQYQRIQLSAFKCVISNASTNKTGRQLWIHMYIRNMYTNTDIIWLHSWLNIAPATDSRLSTNICTFDAYANHPIACGAIATTISHLDTLRLNAHTRKHTRTRTHQHWHTLWVKSSEVILINCTTYWGLFLASFSGISRA